MRKILGSLITIALVATVAVGASRAFFTDTDTSTGNTLTSGTLEMDVNHNNPGGDTFSLNLGTTSNMEPGSETNTATATMTNEGTTNLGWFGYFSWTGDTEMADKLYIKTAQMEFLKPDGVTTWEATDPFITNGVGSGLYAAYFNTLAAGDPTGVISLSTWNSLTANNLMGTGGGVFTGALKPGFKYRLTLQFGMHTSADNTYQGKSLNLTFNVKSTQVSESALVSLDAADTQVSIGAPASIVTWMNTQLGNQTP